VDAFICQIRYPLPPIVLLVTFLVTGFGNNCGRAVYWAGLGALYAYSRDFSFDDSVELDQPVFDVHVCSSLWGL